jgi:hypothetical protein
MRSATTGSPITTIDSARKTARSTYAATASCSWAGSCATRGGEQRRVREPVRQAVRAGSPLRRPQAAAGVRDLRPRARQRRGEGRRAGDLVRHELPGAALRGFVTKEMPSRGAGWAVRRRPEVSGGGEGGGAGRAGALLCVPEHRETSTRRRASRRSPHRGRTCW